MINLSKFTKPITKEEYEEFMKQTEKNMEIDENKVIFKKESIERIGNLFRNIAKQKEID